MGASGRGCAQAPAGQGRVGDLAPARRRSPGGGLPSPRGPRWSGRHLPGFGETEFRFPRGEVPGSPPARPALRRHRIGAGGGGPGGAPRPRPGPARRSPSANFCAGPVPTSRAARGRGPAPSPREPGALLRRPPPGRAPGRGKGLGGRGTPHARQAPGWAAARSVGTTRERAGLLAPAPALASARAYLAPGRTRAAAAAPRPREPRAGAATGGREDGRRPARLPRFRPSQELNIPPLRPAPMRPTVTATAPPTSGRGTAGPPSPAASPARGSRDSPATGRGAALRSPARIPRGALLPGALGPGGARRGHLTPALSRGPCLFFPLHLHVPFN